MQEVNISRTGRNIVTGFSTNIRSGLHIVRDVQGTLWFKHKRNEKFSFPDVNQVKSKM